jgi:hypothetical protein
MHRQLQPEEKQQQAESGTDKNNSPAFHTNFWVRFNSKSIFGSAGQKSTPEPRNLWTQFMPIDSIWASRFGGECNLAERAQVG